MSEQPTGGAPEPVPGHEHVRTDGEISVDDAIGATDDPWPSGGLPTGSA